MKITIDTSIAAPVERAWVACTAPTDILRWNFASDDLCCPAAELDLCVGGAYGFDFEGVSAAR